MMRKLYRLIMGAALVAASVWASPGQAADGSLYPIEEGANLVGDQSALGIGDIITILISEQASASDSSNSSSRRGASSEFDQASGGLKILGDLFGKLGLEGTNTNTGGGSTTHQGSLNARMSARVIDELPNGNFLVEGRREIVINNESQLIKLTGIVRKRDVSPDNTIASALLSDAKISYYGRGPIAEKHKPGILQKVLDVLF